MKTVFKNKWFLQSLIGYISILILWNIYVLIIGRNIWGMIPVIIEITLIILILTRNQYARISVISWAIIALIVASISGLLATVFDIGNNLLDNSIIGAGIGTIIYDLVQLIIGILILDFTRRTVKVEFPVNGNS